MKTTLAWIALLLVVLTGCLPQAKDQSCSTGAVFNPTSRTCVPVTSGGSTSGVSIATRSPAVGSLSTTTNDANQYDFAITVSNPLNEGYLVTWKLYPPSGVSFTGNPLVTNSNTYSLIPRNVSGLTAGLWTLAAEVYNSSGQQLLTSAQWTLSVSGQSIPTLAINPTTSQLPTTTGSRLTTDHSTLTLAVNVADPTGPTSYRLKWFYDGAQQGATVSGSGAAANLNKTFFTSGLDTPAGVHLIRAELSNSTGTTIFSYVEWTIYVTAPNLPQISTSAPPLPDTSVAVSAINTIALNATGFSSASSDLYLNNQDFCVAVNDYDGTLNALGGVTVQFKRNGSVVGMPAPQNFTANNGYVCLGDVMPTFALTLTNPTVGEFQTVSAVVTDTLSSTVVATVNWNISVRVQNTAPVAFVASPASPVSQVQGGQSSASGYSTTYTMSVSDVDTTVANMNVYFFFDGVAMNGVNKFPGTSITTPNCTRPVGSGPVDSTRYQCAVILPAYALSGRINSALTSYTITAYVVDQTTYGGAPMSSNIVSWTVNPTLGQTSPVIAVEGALTSTPTTGLAASATGNSYIALLTSPTTPVPNGTGVAEATNVVFNVLVKDDERDNFNLRIDRCVDSGCTTFANVTPDFLVTRSTDDLGKRVTFSYRLPEDLLVGLASGVVKFRLSVQDKLPSGALSPATPVTYDIDLDITNYNPFPIWAGSTQTSPGLGDVLSVVTGMPLSLDPGAITDASTADGNTILYQWEISLDSGTTWNSITGATSKVLKWTPSQNIAGTNVQLRLCLGDNGTGNPLSLCTGVASPTAPTLPATTRVAGPWTGVVARTNTIAVSASPTMNGDAANWFDASGRAHYLAYVSKNGTDDATIVVEKYSIASNGTLSLAGQVSFKSEATGTAYDASNLSIVGQSITASTPSKTYKGLYISYVTQSATAFVNPRLRVRHIDITDDTFQFDYNGVTESNGTTDNITTSRVGNGAVTITVANATFDAGEVIYINGIALTPTSSASPTSCQFQSGGALTTATVMANIAAAYGTCTTAASDARNFSPAGAVSASTWPITNFPQDWVDLGYSLYLGKAGDVMINTNYVLIPYLDNLNGGKVSVVSIPTTTTLAYGSLGSTGAPYYATATSTTVSTTVAGQDIASSHNGTASFDVALVTSVSGLNAYRMAFTPPSTIAVSSSVTNVFGSSMFIRNPQIASGPATTNNNVFVMAEDAVDSFHDLQYARISGSTYTLASAMPVSPLDSQHEQAFSLTKYKIRAMSGNKRLAMAVLTTSGKVLASLIKPELPSLDFPYLYPADTTAAGDGAGVTYPAVATGVPITTPSLAMTIPQSFDLGDSGATAGENAKESVVILHPSLSASGFNSTYVNVTEEGIQATSAAAADRAKGFQPPYVK